jgi:hypothetical protein
MLRRIVDYLADDSGIIWRGGWAVAFLVVLFIGALFGEISWEGFLVVLAVSAVITAVRSAVR